MLNIERKKKYLFFVAFHFVSFIHSPQLDIVFVSQSFQCVPFNEKKKVVVLFFSKHKTDLLTISRGDREKGKKIGRCA